LSCQANIDGGSLYVSSAAQQMLLARNGGTVSHQETETESDSLQNVVERMPS